MNLANFTDESAMWVIEQKVRGVEDSKIIDSLKALGASRARAIKFLSEAFVFCVRQNRILARRLAKLETVLDIEECLAKSSPQNHSIEKRKRVTSKVFFEEYYYENRPLVLEGLVNAWPAKRKWTLDYFKSKYGATMVETMAGRSNDPHYELNAEHHRNKIRFADFIDLISRGENTNDIYMVANNRTLSRQPFRRLLADCKPVPAFMSRGPQGRSHLWFGPGGTVTPLHHDKLNILFAQVKGRKAIKLISPRNIHRMYNRRGVFSAVDADAPDFGEFPKFQGLKTYQIVLNPGDALFIPVFWWHHVRSLEMSISVSMCNFRDPNRYEIPDP